MFQNSQKIPMRNFTGINGNIVPTSSDLYATMVTNPVNTSYCSEITLTGPTVIQRARMVINN